MKKLITRISLLLVTACCLGIAPIVVSAQGGWNSGPVVVYAQREGRGRSQAFNVGTYRNDAGQLGNLGNDTAASVEVGNGYRVRFCEREGRNGQGEGRCEEFGEGNHNLRYPNMASYIQVSGQGWGTPSWSGSRQGVVVYDDRDFQGTSQAFGVGRYLSGAGQFGALQNDEASSVVVSRSFTVRFCENEGSDGRGSGRCEEYNEGRHNIKMNDEASYIEVRRFGNVWGGGIGPGYATVPVIVYSEKNQEGEQQNFNVGTYRNDQGQLGQIRNDDATSVFVARGYRVRLCENESRNGSGRCEEYGEGNFNLRYNDSASFVRVWRVGR